jgi:hypothetical protein
MGKDIWLSMVASYSHRYKIKLIKINKKEIIHD